MRVLIERMRQRTPYNPMLYDSTNSDHPTHQDALYTLRCTRHEKMHSSRSHTTRHNPFKICISEHATIAKTHHHSKNSQIGS